MSDISSLLRDAFEGDLTSLRMIQLACGFDLEQAARFCCVSPQTFRRWRSDRVPNRTALRLLSIRAGYLPWPEWRGWEMHDGLLFPPGQSRAGISPGLMLSTPILHQLVTEQRRVIEQLTARHGRMSSQRRPGGRARQSVDA